MCSSQTQQFISQVVSNKMASDVMFTLFDVTLEVKKLEKAAGLQVSRHNEIHDDVAAEARQQIVPAGWQRQLQTMGNGLSAFVHYNPNTHDPATYTPLDRKDAPAAQSGVHPSAIAFAAKVPDDNDDDDANQTTPVDGKAPDRWGRLRLPSDVMRQAGFAPGDMVFVRSAGNGLEVSKNPSQDGRRYIVDQYANIRLTPRTLQSANLVGKTTYKITASGGVVSIF